MVREFAAACARGDVSAAERLLHPDAAAVCDGFPIPVGSGAAEVARLAVLLLSGQPGTALTVGSVNGEPGMVLRRGGRAVTIAVLWFVLAPEKSTSWNR